MRPAIAAQQARNMSHVPTKTIDMIVIVGGVWLSLGFDIGKESNAFLCFDSRTQPNTGKQTSKQATKKHAANSKCFDQAD